MSLALLLCVTSVAAAPLDRLLRESREGGHWQQPAAAELRAAEAAFTRLLSAPEDPATVAAWQALDFEIITFEIEGMKFSFVREQAGRREGRGAYLLRHDPTAHWALQAPHVPSDLDTGRIAARLALKSPIRIAAWNTVPRRQVREGTTISADLAHLPESYFTALSRAYATLYPAGRILQLHGFSPTTRRTAAAREADFIVSPARHGQSPAATDLAACLMQSGLGVVKLFPSEVRELGGTTNSQSRTLQALGFDGFIHLEMAPAARQALVAQRTARRAFLACLR